MAVSDLSQAPHSPREGGAHPSLATRARVRLRRVGLDLALAAGADPGKSRELALRAAQLVEPAVRRRLAEQLVEPVLHSEGYSGASSARVPLNQRSIRAHAGAIRRLAGRLDANTPADPRGVALASLLVHDGASPLYGHGRDAELRDAVERAFNALGPR